MLYKLSGTDPSGGGSTSSSSGNAIYDSFSKAISDVKSFFTTQSTQNSIIKTVFDYGEVLLKFILQVLIFVAGVSAMIAISIFGVQFILYSGNPQRTARLRRQLGRLLLGVIIAFSAYTIWKVAIALFNVLMEVLI